MWADIRIITRSTVATLQGRPAEANWYDVHRITGVEMTGALARAHGKTKRPIPRLPQTTWSPSYRQRGAERTINSSGWRSVSIICPTLSFTKSLPPYSVIRGR